jgi:hypothetical protein
VSDEDVVLLRSFERLRLGVQALVITAVICA